MVTHPILESRFFAAVELIGALDFVRARAARDPRHRRGVRLSVVAGLIERYRDRLPFAPGDPAISLHEGSTPLVPRAAAVGARRRRGPAQARGREPDRLVQGPRHDLRGVGRGARRAPRRSSAPRPATRRRAWPPTRRGPGCAGAVIVPEGKIATGKLAQALMHGARVIALRGNFDQALELVRELVRAPPDRARQLGQPAAPGGPEDGGLRDRRGARRDRRALHPRRQRGQRHRLLEGLQGAGPRAADARLPGRGRGAARARRARRAPRDGRQRDPDRQPGPLGGGDGGVHASRAARSRWSATRRSSTAYRRLAAGEGIFCEPASAASVAGLLKHGAGGAQRVVCVLTGHGLKDPQTALEQSGSVVPCAPELGAVERAILGLTCSAAASSASPPPRRTWGPASTRSPRRWPCTWSSRSSRRGRFAVETELRHRARRAQPRRPRLRAPGRPGRLHVPHPLRHPAGRRLRDERRGLRRGADGRRPPLRARRRRAGARLRARGPPRQRGRGGARRLRRRAPTARRPASTRRPGLEALAVVPHTSVRTKQARAAMPPEVPVADAVFNVAHGALLVLGLARGDWDLVARGLDDRLHQPHREHLFPRSMELVAPRARARRAGRDDLRRGPVRARLVPLRADRRRRRGPAPRGRRLGATCCARRSSRTARTCARSSLA